MDINELYSVVRAYPAAPYDPRWSVAMTVEQYEAYKINTGHTYYVFLNKLVNYLKPRRILELGTSIGRSAMFMMTALPPNSELVTVDIGSFLRSELMPFADDPRLKIVFGNDLDLDVRAEITAGFDMLFIDSEHSIEHLTQEWAIYRKMLVDGAVVVMDDIHLNDGMSAFWNALPYEKVDTGTDLHFSGFGLFIYKHQK